MPSIRPSSALLAFAASTIVLGLAGVAGAQTAAVAMPVPSAVSGATYVSHLNSASTLSGSISIAPADRAGLKAYGDSISDPKSPNYHRWLTPLQIGQRFGAPAATVNGLVTYLTSKGLSVTMVADSHTAILFRGRVDKLEGAFGVRINNYRAPRRTDGPKEFYAFNSVPRLPSAYAAKVVTIQGLENTNPPKPRTTQLTPSQARQLYAIAALYDGTFTGVTHYGEGVNIGITNFDGYRLSNLTPFYATFGLPVPTNGVGSNVKKVIVGGVDGESQNPGGEADLDIQMVAGMAPKSNIYIYDGIGGGLISTLAKEAQDNIVDVVSESYGFRSSDDFYIAAHDQHLAMTAQGITYMCASGDNGTADLVLDPYPDFDPDVLMVGGSDATTDADGNRQSELGWDGSGSGWFEGNVPFNVLPPYQKGPGVPTNINRRLIPDIALHATSWAIYYNGSEINIGGTSASSPSFAGQLGIILQSLIEQDAADPAPNGRPRLGRVMDFFYTLNGQGTSFLDLTGGDAGALPNGDEAIGKATWDFVTGIGAPIDTGLYNAYLLNASTTVSVDASTAALVTVTSPSLTLGTNASGTASDLTVADGKTFSARTVTQNGVGQVAALRATYALPNPNPRSAALTVSMTAPAGTTNFIYLRNFATNAFDAVAVVGGSGSAKTTVVPIDLTKYLAGNVVEAIVRSERPSRLGIGPYRFSVDQAEVTERVPKNSTP